MGLLSHLPGVKEKDTEAIFYTNKKLISKILAERKAITNSGSNGAWNVWKDDEGVIRGELMKYRSTLESKATKSIAEAKTWITEWNTFIH